MSIHERYEDMKLMRELVVRIHTYLLGEFLDEVIGRVGEGWLCDR